MSAVLALASVVLLVIVLRDAFESVILPRRVKGRFRLTRAFYQVGWQLWSAPARRRGADGRKSSYLSVFGPLSMLGLFALWVLILVVAFGVLHWSIGTDLREGGAVVSGGLGACLYFSGVTFFTLGFGDVTPAGPVGRALAVSEVGLGFGFLAIVIGYLPVLYQAFSRREVTISLLDARAGSPPSAGQLLLRLAGARDLARLDRFLEDWERWSAELLESHLSFPVLSYYRSQHDNQSWLAALTAILDTSALVIAEARGADPYQSQLTFAMARHAAVDLALVFQTPPMPIDPSRLPAEGRARLRSALLSAGLALRDDPAAAAKLDELRGAYEPFLIALGRHFLLAVPPIWRGEDAVDNWQTSAWTRRTAGIGGLAASTPGDDHFD